MYRLGHARLTTTLTVVQIVSLGPLRTGVSSLHDMHRLQSSPEPRSKSTALVSAVSGAEPGLRAGASLAPVAHICCMSTLT